MTRSQTITSCYCLRRKQELLDELAEEFVEFLKEQLGQTNGERI